MNKKIFIPIAIIALALIIGCSTIFLLPNNQEKNTQYLHASWEYNYANIEELSKNSDLIALVQVDDVENTEITDGILFTEFKVNVTESIYNSENIESFIIYMTGGENEDVIMEIEDDPLMQNGENFLVFCQKNSNGTYSILGGPQGRLVYENGAVNSLNVTNSRAREANSSFNIEIQNADYKELVEEIKGYLN